MAAIHEIHRRALFLQLDHRLVDAAMAYCFTLHYFTMGIPDDEWCLSPARSGVSVEYFPHFEPHHFQIKQWFDFFVDAFYYKLFTAWDVIGHILNASFPLGLEKHKVTFRRVVDSLRDIDPVLFGKLSPIIADALYVEGSAIRNDITHNYLPHSTGFAVSLTESGAGVGLLPYITARRLMANIDGLIVLFSDTIAQIPQGKR